MKSTIISTVNVLVFLLSIYCSYGQVRSDYDKSNDFNKYKTYTFKGWEKDSDQQLNDFDQQRITDAFKHELEIRGFTHEDSNPDVGITLFVVVDERTSKTAYTNYTGGFGYGRSWGWGPGMGTSTTTYSERDYRVGTIVIDFYDEETKKLVFQATMQTEVKEKAKKREKSIPKNVAKLMKKYPVKPKK
ncbi:MAG: DUF4136 domain-containing protein [Cyclobacteriaceae bacterium]|nr:DUF4136 domain-containing protein [Cyclobacteriaceae bacterium]MCK5370842.1 DUF4136 domain-containing protein [Cyclobacteriaceae bacterium]